MKEGFLPLLFLLQWTTLTVVSQSCQEGAVEIIGTVTDILVAGRLEICVDGRWHAVYDSSWGIADVTLLCHERGFPQEGAAFCTKSCFGSSDRLTGYSQFICGGAIEFGHCTKEFIDERLPEENAGIICTKEVTVPSCPDSTQCPDPLPCLPTLSTTPKCNCSNCSAQDHDPTISSGGQQQSDSMVGETSGEEGMISNTVVVDQDNCVAVGAALGAVVAILLLILLTIIVLWAWSCKKIKTTKERYTDNTMDNPTYSATTTVITPAQYSSLGPQDTPSTGRITNTSTEEEEVEYHEIGERGRATYETQNSDDTYNRLQNH